jgi:hypothetical protein
MLLREFLNRTGEGKACVVGWGRGMGHKGHMMLASSVITQANETGSDPYFVLSRSVGKDDPLHPDEKLNIYRKVFPNHGQIFHVATEEMPDLTRVLHKLNGMGYNECTVVVGADQVKALSYVKQYNGIANKQGDIPFNFDRLDVIARQETNDPSREEEGPRATPMRDILKDPNASEEQRFQAWRDAMSPELSDDEVRNLMHKAGERMHDPAFGKKPKKEKVAEVSVKYANGMIREMRAKQFIKEHGGTQAMHGHHKAAIKNATTFPAMNMSTGSQYLGYRMGVALAGAPDYPTKIEADNWIGGDPLLAPYTEEENEMINAAAKQVGGGKRQTWSNNRSLETADVNKLSAVAKPKKNKYGI